MKISVNEEYCPSYRIEFDQFSFAAKIVQMQPALIPHPF